MPPGAPGRRLPAAAAVLAAAWVAGAPGTVRAGEDPPKPPPAAAPGAKAADAFVRDLDALHGCVAQRQWKQGFAAAQALLARHAADPRLVARLAEVEEDLRLCTWRTQRKPPAAKDVIGRGATKFSFDTRTAEFEWRELSFRDRVLPEGWSRADSVWVFDVPFQGPVAVSTRFPTEDGDGLLRLRALALPVCFLCFESEPPGGYAFTLLGTMSRFVVDLQGDVQRLGEGATPFRRSQVHSGVHLEQAELARLGGDLEVRWSRTGSGTLSMTVNGQRATETTDHTHKRGLVGFAWKEGLLPDLPRLRIVGQVEPAFAKRLENDAEDAAYRAWVERDWSRERALPAAVLAAERRLPPAPLPSDATAEIAAAAPPFVVRALDGDAAAAASLRSLASAAPPRTGRFLAGLAELATGEPGAAADLLREVVRDEPAYGPGWSALVQAQIHRGDRDGARRSVEAAQAAAAGDAALWDAVALVAFSEGRLDAAEAALDESGARAAVSPIARALRRILVRARRGPQWARRVDFESAHYRISTDATLPVCMEVAAVLEEAHASYRTKFRPDPGGPKPRVLLFSGVDGYLDYARDMGSDFSGTLGVYQPRLRELCVFLHEDRRTLWDTVRHEAFHQYLHRFVEDAPMWFNEGYAEYFGYVRKRGGRHLTGLAGASAVKDLRAAAPRFVPLPELFTMARGPFMANAAVHYVQSWAAIHMFRESADPQVASLFAAYSDALLAGMSRQEAYDEVLKPHAARIDLAFRAHVASLTRE